MARLGHVVTLPQREVGRYYSFMPAVLKDVCVHKFTRMMGKE
jgi:hypothetical protein